MTNIAYDPYLCYVSNKLKTIAFVHQLKAFFVSCQATQIVQFLLDD